MKQHIALDMVLNSILNLVLEKLPTDPGTPTQGRIYYNTTSNKIRFADGTSWNDFGTSMTGGDILSALLAVDGDGSGLDADLLDGQQAAAFAPASHNHSASQITDFAAAVDARILAAFTNEAVDATVDTIAEFTQLIKDNEADIAAILSIKRYAQNVGNGTDTTITVTHNLNTTDALVQIKDAATGERVIADVIDNGANAVDLVFSVAPSTNEFRVIILA